jgi:hypothetical protein
MSRSHRAAYAPAFGEARDFNDELYDALRQSPWWMISIGVHVLLVVLSSMFQSGEAAVVEKSPTAEVTLPPEKPELPEPEAPTAEDEVDSVVVEDVVAQEVQIKDAPTSDHNEDDNDSDFHEPAGDGSGISNGPWEGPGTNAMIGIGGGGGGSPFGRGGRWNLRAPRGQGHKAQEDAVDHALLAFLGAGYTHRDPGPFGKVVAAGLRYLKGAQDAEGCFGNRASGHFVYNHAIAALAMVEAYGMTGSPMYKGPAQKGLEFIALSRNAYHAWRYGVKPGENDTSVTGWMMMALKSGELAGLNVPKGTYARIEKWLDASQQSPSEPHLYRYNPFAPDTPEQRHGRKASKTMTSVGLLMRLYSGWRRDNGNMIRGAEYLAQNLPAIGTPRQPERDTYYWYYGTQVMFHMGGEYWQRWNSRLHPLIVESQVPAGPLAGSWDPKGAVPDRWGPHGGRLYVTTLNLLSLEVFYRHLPLYEDTAK